MTIDLWISARRGRTGEGEEKALEEYTGLNPSEPLFGRILDVYRALGIAKK